MKIISNKRKSVGAYVWHNGYLKRITNQDVGKDHVLIDNRHKVKRRDAHLARTGDEVKYLNLEILPKRCTEYSSESMYITSFSDNDTVCTSRDIDGSHFSHFKSATGLPSTKTFRRLEDAY